MHFEYTLIFLFVVICLFVSILIFFLSYFFIPQELDYQKISSYECGFNNFEDARLHFDVRFYLISILFLIFDLEISFLFPWTLVLNQVSKVAFWYMFWFLFILTLGFIYEWCKGALNWD
uniref:NADH dehydrogenase subunit 3 n=1 Tax=Neorhodella cyanea TaxID=131155 RepID=UPI001FCE16D2|nr:NADH dehydrogenase subunit 3 [Neorhodella cyanea]UNJ18807.1 NADH dehydrogenase subunit 3 [Neorhodella cyanea]